MQGTVHVHTQKQNCTLVRLSAFEAILSRVCWEPNLLTLSPMNVLITEIKSHTEIFKLYKIQLKTKKGSDYNIIIALAAMFILDRWLFCTRR